MSSTWTLGISAYYHDSAVALLQDSKIVACAQEERFSRVRHDASFPGQALRYCLQEARCGVLDLDQIIFYDKPFLKFDRILETYLAHAPAGFGSFQKSLPIWIKEKLFLKQVLIKELLGLTRQAERRHSRKLLASRLGFSEHHLSHAASAFYPSPYTDAAVLVLDGVGEWATTSLFFGEGNQLQALQEIHFPHSLGLLYSAFTAYCGFKVNSGEYKLMGLSPYGRPKYVDLIKTHLVEVADDGSFQLNMAYFNYCTDLKMTSTMFDRLFGGSPRLPEEPITERHQDLAASIQAVTEEILLKMVRKAAKDLPTRNLCLAGGVALNCVANGKILRDGKFQNMWIQPAAGDSGGALGASFVGYYSTTGRARKPVSQDSMEGAFLGPSFSDSSIREELKNVGGCFHEMGEEELIRQCSSLLARGKALGWFQGRMEFGPRALGARSILADPRSKTMQSDLNMKIKFRESFRPFAPAVLREDLEKWFRLGIDSPYMLFVADVIVGEIPAVTHVDGSARVQTVHPETNPLFYKLLKQFKSDTGCPILVNTSFNVRGEPIVNTPVEAFRCLMGTNLDALAIGSFLLLKEEQNPNLRESYFQNIPKD